MNEEPVSYQLEGPMALIGLNRPGKRNAMNETVIAALRAAVVRAGEEADVGVLFGHGPGGHPKSPSCGHFKIPQLSA